MILGVLYCVVCMQVYVSRRVYMEVGGWAEGHVWYINVTFDFDTDSQAGLKYSLYLGQ